MPKGTNKQMNRQADGHGQGAGSPSGLRLIKPPIKGKRLLQHQLVQPTSQLRVHQQIPAMPRDTRRDQHKRMLTQQLSTELLLAATWGTRYQPVRVGNAFRLHHINPGRVQHSGLRKTMGLAIQRIEILMHRHLKDGRRGIQGRINRGHTFRVPAPTHLFSPHAQMPGGSILSRVKAPEMNLTAQRVFSHQ